MLLQGACKGLPTWSVVPAAPRSGSLKDRKSFYTIIHTMLLQDVCKGLPTWPAVPAARRSGSCTAAASIPMLSHHPVACFYLPGLQCLQRSGQALARRLQLLLPRLCHLQLGLERAGLNHIRGRGKEGTVDENEKLQKRSQAGLSHIAAAQAKSQH